MPTNSIKQRMLREAKRIANFSYQGIKEIQRGADGSIISESYYPPSYFMNIDIEELLADHLEYDEDIFRGMIRTFQKKDNSNELSD